MRRQLIVPLAVVPLISSLSFAVTIAEVVNVPMISSSDAVLVISLFC